MAINENPYADTPQHEQTRAGHSRRLVTGCAIFVLIIVPLVGAIAFFLGVNSGESSAYHRRAMDQMVQIEDFLRKHPDKFSRIAVYEASSGFSYMMGTVSSSVDLALLKSEMCRLFGEKLAHDMTWRVKVSPVLGSN